MSVKNHCFELKGVTNTWVKHNLSGIMLMVGVILLAGCATTKRQSHKYQNGHSVQT